MNEDVEVVHYAITAMVELSKEYDYRLQKIEKKYTNDPEDVYKRQVLLQPSGQTDRKSSSRLFSKKHLLDCQMLYFIIGKIYLGRNGKFEAGYGSFRAQ